MSGAIVALGEAWSHNPEATVDPRSIFRVMYLVLGSLK